MDYTSDHTAEAPIHFAMDGAFSQVSRAGAGPLCSTCHLRAACVPAGLAAEDVRRLDGLLFARRRIREGQVLYRQGDRFRFVHAVRSGTFKTVASRQDGRERVTAFAMAGDVLGVDGVAGEAYPTTATALEDGEVCAIPHAHLHQAALESRGMHDLLARLLGREIVRDHGVMALLGTMNTDERLAAFLLDLSRRMKALGYSPHELHLRMSRAEIGSYLGVTLETVSRTFSTFQRRGWLQVAKKHVRILDLATLARLVEGEAA